MTIYADFDSDEQRLLLRSLEAAGIVVSAASLGRKEETASEGFAVASRILESRHEHIGDPLISSVILAIEERVAAEQPFPSYERLAEAEGAKAAAMATLRDVVALLDARATTDEAAGYKRWLMELATVAAQAGKEDQGFLGRGGVLVNDAERAALGEVAAVLGIDPEG